MDYHACVAMPAHRLPAAGGAKQGWRIAATVDEQERLLAALQAVRDGTAEQGGNAVVFICTAARDQPHPRQGRMHGCPLPEPQPRVAPAPCLCVCLERRRGASQDHRDIAQARTIDREIASVVANAVLLLVRGIVLFVDDDEPQLRQLREDGQAGAHDELRIAARRSQPMRAARSDREAAVQQSDANTGQRGSDTLLELRRQVDLRDQKKRLKTSGDDPCGPSQIYLAFSASGHPLQKGGEKAQGMRYGRFNGRALRIVQRKRHGYHRVCWSGLERLHKAFAAPFAYGAKRVTSQPAD